MLTEVLILGLGQVKNTISVAGMTTEQDAVTGLRWVRPIKTDGPLTLDDLRYDDGSLVRLGDVIQLDLEAAPSAPPFVENVAATFGQEPPVLIRELTEARRGAFFSRQIDPEPRAVLSRQPQRSLCLVKPDQIEAVFSFDAEMERFEARLMPRIGALYSEDGIPVNDVFWRTWGEQQLQGEEYLEIDDARLREMLGEIYLTLALNARGRIQVLGVHTIPDYTTNLDVSSL